jgi:hypothetical protein
MAIPFLNNINLNDNELQNVKLHLTGSSPGDNQGQIYLHNTQNKVKVYTTEWKNVAFEDWVTSNYPGTVTSVGLTMPSAFTVGNSPITSSGDIGVTGAGTSAQYIDGTGALQTFPTGIMFNFTVAGDLGTNQTITNTNTLTISGGTAIVTTGVNTDEIEVKHDTVSRTNTTSTGAPVNGGAFTAIDSITSSAEGHITAVNTKTVTLPSFNFSLAAVSSNATVLTLDASVGDDDTVTFEGTTNEIEITTPATGDAGTVKIGLPDNVTITNDLTVGGDINVTGSLNSYTTSELLVQDQYITLNSGQTSGILDAFVKVERGATDVALKWNESTDRWQFTNDGSTYYNIPISSEYDNFSFSVEVGSSTQEVSNGGVLLFTQGGGLTVGMSGDDTITYSHADTSSQASVDNSGRTYIQDITLDDYGHITGIASATETVVDTQLATAAALIDVSAMGSNTTASFTHGLASKNLIVQMYDVTTGEVVFADIDHTSNNAISVIFASTPSNDIRVVVIDAKNGLTDKTVSYS